MMIGHLFELMGDVEKDDAWEGADEEYDIEPAMVEAELELTEDFCDDHSVLSWHVHSHEKNWRDEIHALER